VGSDDPKRKIVNAGTGTGGMLVVAHVPGIGIVEYIPIIHDPGETVL
jgi:hypothetical protein